MAEIGLKKAIQERIAQEKEAILFQAGQEAEKILSQAGQDAASGQEGFLAQSRKNCLLKKTKEFNSLAQEARKQLLEKKEEKIFVVFSQVKENLMAVRQDSSRYNPIFRNLLRESRENIAEETKLKLKVNPLDEGLASELIKELKLPARIETKDSIDGGLELLDEEETTSVLNTFASRLHKLMPELRQEVSKILFGE